MRRTRSTIDNVSENVIHDIWTEAMDVNLSQDWTGTARFQSLPTRFKGYIWVSGRPTRVQKITKPDSICPEAWMQFSKNSSKKKLQIGRQKMRNFRQHTATQIFEVSIDSKDYLKVTAIARLKFDKWTWSCYAFHYERRQQRCRLSTLPSRSQVACWAALRPQSFKLVWLRME